MPEIDTAEVRRARQLSRAFMAGGPRSFDAFRELAQLLLQATVLEPGQAVRLSGRRGRRGDDVRFLTGRGGATDPLRLRDGRWLRLALTLYLDAEAQGRLKVRRSSFQYQADRAGDRPIFRYDYLRVPKSTEPPAHLNLYGELAIPGVLAASRPLSRVHFPTGRVSMEAGIRLLADDFAVPTATDAAEWRSLLAVTEAAFRAIAHRP